ncbi:MAG: DUF1573 domain-containing protein [Flavobacteriales bacterium]|nr:DUF1573 domain-containing protein [Flavobacteriales bacterium]MCB9196217.1 DUF1573 domain-containing protein [Flavobacteriales bacterium]
MDKVKIGLIGLVLVLSAFSIYQISELKGEINDLRNDLTTNINALKSTQVAAGSNNGVVTNPVSSNANNTNQLPSTNVKPVGPTTSIKFAEEIHNFGTVEVESENLYSFEFTNTGSEPLEISNAKGSCGCTVPNWPKEPIMPGKSATIDVKFTPNTGQAGQEVEKVVTVTANTVPENTMVRIKANVIAK